MDRSKWSTYANFTDMYDHNIEEIEVSGVAKWRNVPVWIDMIGTIYNES